MLGIVILCGAVWIIWSALDDVPEFHIVSSKWSSHAFDDMIVRGDLSRACIDRYMERFVGDVVSDVTHDLSYGRIPEFAIDMRIRLVTVNPRPIWMYQARNTQAMLKYQAEDPMETNERMLLRTMFRKASANSFVMDIGSNDGFYALLAAAYGHRVAAFEPQPNCAALLFMSMAFNSFRHTPKLFQNFASSSNTTIKMGRHAACLPTRRFDVSSADADFDEVTAINPAQVFRANGDEALLIHIDVEGAEINVLRDLAEIIASKRVRHVVFESVPSRWHYFDVLEFEGFDLMRRVFNGMLCRSVLTFDVIYDFAHIDGSDIWCTTDSDKHLDFDVVSPDKRLVNARVRIDHT